MYGGFGKLPTDVVHSPGPSRSTRPMSAHLPCSFGQSTEFGSGLLAWEELEPGRRADSQTVRSHDRGQLFDLAHELVRRLQFRIACIDDPRLDELLGGTFLDQLHVLRPGDQIEPEPGHGKIE